VIELLLSLLAGLAAVYVLAFLLLVYQWRRARAATERVYSEPLKVVLSDMPDLPGKSARIGEAWQSLGYEPAGALVNELMPHMLLAVYTHPDLPVYAGILVFRKNLAWPYLLSYFRGGGKITTTATAAVGGAVAEVETEAPRMVQFQADAPPVLLHHQHRKAVEEWAAQGLEPLPAARDALVGYAVADHEALRPGIRAAGWLPFSTYLRVIYKRPRGVVRF
jgi:hypothetical protein